MNPGYYPDFPREQYDAIKAMRYSLVKHAVSGTMRDLHAHMCAPNTLPDKRCFLLGRAFEARLEGLDVFAGGFVAAPEGFSRAAHKKWATFIAEADGREILTHIEGLQIEGMYKAVQDQAGAMGLLTDGDPQPAIFWWDADSGVDCKGMLDRYAGGVVVDLKTARAESDRAWRYAVRDYGYDIQAAMYTDGLRAFDMAADQFVWVVVRKSWPYTVNLIRAPDVLIEEGRQKYRSVLTRYTGCVKSGVYPGWGGLHDLVMDGEPINLEELLDGVF